MHRFQNSLEMLRIKANYKLVDFQTIKGKIRKEDVGFIVTGENIGKHKNIIQKLFYSFCGGKV